MPQIDQEFVSNVYPACTVLEQFCVQTPVSNLCQVIDKNWMKAKITKSANIWDVFLASVDLSSFAVSIIRKKRH